MLGSLLASLFASAAAVGACSVYDTSLFHAPANTGGKANGGGANDGGGGDNKGGGGANTGGGGGGNDGKGGAAGCVLDVPPDPAPPNDAGTGGNEEAVGIMYRIDLGDAPNNPTNPPHHFLDLGFDVDGICTTSQNPKAAQCNIPSYGFGVLDGPGGLDNALGQIVQTTRNQIKGFSSDVYSAQLKEGVTNVIVHLTGYNGQANDDQVRVETLVSAKFDSLPQNKGKVPKWDGTDEWPVASDSVVNNDITKPKFVDEKSYVVNHKIVTHLKSTSLRLVVGLTTLNNVTVQLDVAMHGAVIVCDLVPNDGDVRIWNWKAQHCNLSARWLVNDLLHQLSHFPDPGGPTSLCTDSPLYPTFKDNICGLVDV